MSGRRKELFAERVMLLERGDSELWYEIDGTLVGAVDITDMNTLHAAADRLECYVIEFFDHGDAERSGHEHWWDCELDSHAKYAERFCGYGPTKPAAFADALRKLAPKPITDEEWNNADDI